MTVKDTEDRSPEYQHVHERHYIMMFLYPSAFPYCSTFQQKERSLETDLSSVRMRSTWGYRETGSDRLEKALGEDSAGPEICYVITR